MSDPKYRGLTELSTAVEALERGTAAPGDRISQYVNELGERVSKIEEQTPPTAEVGEQIKQLIRRVSDLEDGRTGDDVRHFVSTLGARVGELEQKMLRIAATGELGPGPKTAPPTATEGSQEGERAGI